MTAETIPVLWDDDRVSLATFDERGILRLRPSANREAGQKLELLKGEMKMPTFALPIVHAPALSPVEAQALLDEIAWHRK
jgi:hypothetical protein